MLEHLCAPCHDHFEQVKTYLQKLNIPFGVNARMVRGLDYYVRTTFELVTDQLGAQNAVAAGGRYDGLVESIGGPALPGIGFAIGLERLVLMKDEQQIPAATPQLFIAAVGNEATDYAFVLMSQLQAAGVRAEMDYFGKSLKAQMRRANKLNANLTLILGEQELQSGEAQLKNMSDGSQSTVALKTLFATLVEKLGRESSCS